MSHLGPLLETEGIAPQDEIKLQRLWLKNTCLQLKSLTEVQRNEGYLEKNGIQTERAMVTKSSGKKRLGILYEGPGTHAPPLHSKNSVNGMHIGELPKPEDFQRFSQKKAKQIAEEHLESQLAIENPHFQKIWREISISYKDRLELSPWMYPNSSISQTHW